MTNVRGFLCEHESAPGELGREIGRLSGKFEGNQDRPKAQFRRKCRSVATVGQVGDDARWNGKRQECQSPSGEIGAKPLEPVSGEITKTNFRIGSRW